MQSLAADYVVPRDMKRANDVVRKLMRYYASAGRNGCRNACAQLFGHESWESLGLSCGQIDVLGPFDEECVDLPRRRRAQARLLCSSLGGVDPDEHCDRPVRAHGSLPDPVGDNLLAELRLVQAGRRYQQLLARVLVDELQPTASKPQKGTGAEMLASASRGTIAALPLYLARWWSVNLKHQREVGHDLSNVALDADSRADLLKFGQYWGSLCMYHAYGINWTMVIGTACLLAERYADLSLPLMAEIHAFRARRVTGESAEADYEVLCQLHWLKVLEYLSVFPRDDLEQVVQAQPKAFLADGDQVLKILSNPRSTLGTWRSGLAR